MSKTPMPEPVVEFRVDQMGIDHDHLFTGEITHLDAGYYKAITTDQAEAYKDACVRAALERAIAICDAAYKQGESEYKVSGCNPYFEGGRDAAESIESKIRALIPK